jgi:hypothetical protein
MAVQWVAGRYSEACTRSTISTDRTIAEEARESTPWLGYSCRCIGLMIWVVGAPRCFICSFERGGAYAIWDTNCHCFLKLESSHDSPYQQPSCSKILAMAATTLITRVTMIKIPNEEHIPIALKGFETFAKHQQKVGSHVITFCIFWLTF